MQIKKILLFAGLLIMFTHIGYAQCSEESVFYIDYNTIYYDDANNTVEVSFGMNYIHLPADFNVTNIKYTWSFGDGTPPVTRETSDQAYYTTESHKYNIDGTYLNKEIYCRVEFTGHMIDYTYGGSSAEETICYSQEDNFYYTLPTNTVVDLALAPDYGDGLFPYNEEIDISIKVRDYSGKYTSVSYTVWYDGTNIGNGTINDYDFGSYKKVTNKTLHTDGVHNINVEIYKGTNTLDQKTRTIAVAEEGEDVDEPDQSDEIKDPNIVLSAYEVFVDTMSNDKLTIQIYDSTSQGFIDARSTAPNTDTCGINYFHAGWQELWTGGRVYNWFNPGSNIFYEKYYCGGFSPHNDDEDYTYTIEKNRHNIFTEDRVVCFFYVVYKSICCDAVGWPCTSADTCLYVYDDDYLIIHPQTFNPEEDNNIELPPEGGKKEIYTHKSTCQGITVHNKNNPTDNFDWLLDINIDKANLKMTIIAEPNYSEKTRKIEIKYFAEGRFDKLAEKNKNYRLITITQPPCIAKVSVPAYDYPAETEIFVFENEAGDMSYSTSPNYFPYDLVKDKGTQTTIKIKCFDKDTTQIAQQSFTVYLTNCWNNLDTRSSLRRTQIDYLRALNDIVMISVEKNILFDMEINDGEKMVITAGGRIRLDDGFRAKPGSFFQAKNANCSDIANTSNPNTKSTTVPVSDGYNKTKSYEQETYTEYEAFQEKSIDSIISPASVNIYPNPTDGVINIEFRNITLPVTLKVYNSNGMVIYNQQVTKISDQIDISGYAKGFYFFNVISQNNCFTDKILYQ